jgi:Ca2+-binding RTX toxin-like protein
VRHPTARIGVTLAAAAGLLLAAAPAADAAVYTSNGVRCTIVGTGGADHLVGTAGRDVICGLGGNDSIDGRGGDDVIDSGSGNDRVTGGLGNDVIFGGAGADTIVGAAGNDRLYGGDGTDRVAGGDGNDYASGGGAADVISGDAGSDVDSGGAGNDTLTGGSGTDALFGGDGNDDLDGGTGTDAEYGGYGTNWCTTDSADTQRQRCLYDQRAPSVLAVQLSPATVDVTSASVAVTLRVHAVDDTGVRYVQAGAQSADASVAVPMGSPTLVSGTVRDGWWQSRFIVPRWLPPAALNADIWLTDRAGRLGYGEFAGAFTVVDLAPDRRTPTVASVTLTPSTGAWPLDVRAADRSVTVTAHITDDVSGVLGLPDLCVDYPSDGDYLQAGACGQLTRVAGTTRDGTWRGTVTVPKGGVGGDWDVRITATDIAHPAASPQWFGPDNYRAWTEDGAAPDPCAHLFPNGAGAFAVLGVYDPQPADLVSVTITPATVDTLTGDAAVDLAVLARDRDGDGVTAVGAALRSTDPSRDGPSWPPVEAQAPSSGTTTDGVWHLALTLPQGTAVGSYPLQVWVQDAGHWRCWVAPSSPSAGDSSCATLTPDQLGGSDGTVTVVPRAG